VRRGSAESKPGWPNLPRWYDLAVAIPAAPAALLGGILARRSEPTLAAA
jgi:hypothetical protein